MRKIIVPLFSLMAVWSALSFRPGKEMLAIGSEAPLADYAMMDVVSERRHSLEDLKGEKGLLVIFSCNTCPFVLAWEDQYPLLGKMAAEKGLGMVLVNSNAAKRSGDDAPEAMLEHYGEAGYNVPYLIDRESKLANAMGARTTPHVYLFDQNLRLRYRGSINDKYENKDKVARKLYLQDAIESLLAGTPISPAETKEIGCSIKRS